MSAVQTFSKTQQHVKAVRFEGGREDAMAIVKWAGGGAYIPATNTDPREYVQINSMYGPRDVKVGEYVVQVDDGQFIPFKPEPFSIEFRLVTDEETSMVKHARAELERFPNEDPDFVESIMAAIKGFDTYRGHSGGSSAVAIHMLTRLLNRENLLPLTDDEEEWEFRPGKDYGLEYDLWQNKRNSKALSADNGKTYYLVDGPLIDGEKVFYDSEFKDFVPEIEEEDLKSDDEKEEANGSDLS